MTKREALRECRKMWLWLAKNPGKFKTDYPGIGEWDCECPCCEYCSTQKANCDECPLRKLWGGRLGDASPCVESLSPYKKWLDSQYSDTKSAMRIADACKEKRKR